MQAFALPLSLLVFITSGCTAPRESSSSLAGMAKQNLTVQFGELVSANPPRARGTRLGTRWGNPAELAMGTTIELWVYRAKGGTVERYFLNGIHVAKAGAFSPKGAVYEDRPGTALF